ncbi:MAG: YHS domain-containing protein [Cytophagales bacterium]|nr:YHS domain-containing protein [Cytophagales bacterium]
MKTSTLLLLSLCLALWAHGQDVFTKSGIAIGGYDPVAYHSENKAAKGKPELKLKYQGAVYQFASEANREAFKAAPLKYLPQYGGYCAYAMGKDGKKVEINPETFKVVEGKLYLFYNDSFFGVRTNTLPPWNADEATLKKKADENWRKLSSK